MAINKIKFNSYQEWLFYRMQGLGASEMPTIFGFNKFESAFQLFDKKIGAFKSSYPNMQMAFGSGTEDISSKFYDYFELDADNTMRNIYNGKKLRTCKKLPEFEYLVNDKYPFIFISPDRKIDNGYLEIKHTYDSTANTWDKGYQVSHMIQNKLQISVLEESVGHLFYLIGNSGCRLFEFKNDGYIVNDEHYQITFENWIIGCKEFWGRVLKGRQINAQYHEALRNYNNKLADELLIMLDEIRPDADSSLAFEKYIKAEYYEKQAQKYKYSVQGTDEQYQIVTDYVKLSNEKKEVENKLQLAKNKILKMCLNNKILFGKDYVEVQSNKKNTQIKTNVQ